MYDPATKYVTIENTFLTSDNNIEGLGYWSKRNRLMLACKGSPSAKHKYERSKAVYDFDIAENKLKKKPMFLITKDKIKEYVTAKNATGLMNKLHQQVRIKDAMNFAPSGIAVHPTSQHIYIISSHGHTLFVVDEKGKILHIEFLNQSKFHQPEGIVFDLDGTLYISNEGEKAKASILEFREIPKNNPGKLKTKK